MPYGGVDMGRNRHQACQNLTDKAEWRSLPAPSHPMTSYAKSIVNKQNPTMRVFANADSQTSHRFSSRRQKRESKNLSGVLHTPIRNQSSILWYGWRRETDYTASTGLAPKSWPKVIADLHPFLLTLFLAWTLYAEHFCLYHDLFGGAFRGNTRCTLSLRACLKSQSRVQSGYHQANHRRINHRFRCFA